MRRMGFCPAVIELSRALVSEGHAKVHVNGRFTKSFKLQRGVRQGCPISPFLFAISTQPLMSMLREGEKKGDLVGINVPRGRALLHRFFADDSGVAIKAEEQNFSNLCRIIESFERIFGAQLNPAKLVIIPFALEQLPAWIQETGCQVLMPGQYITYLGCRFGVENAEAERARDLRSKLQNKLGSWANRFLTWASWVLLLQHVLRAIPVYQFLGLSLHKTSYKQLEAPCRAFLWGTNSDNKTKTALARRFLQLDDHELVLPGSLTLRQLQELLARYRTQRAFNDRVVYPLLKRLGVRVLANLMDGTGKWWDIARKLNTNGILLDQVQTEAIGTFQTWLHSVQIGTQKLENSPSWRWKGTNDSWSGWSLSSRTWHKLHATDETIDDLSDKWPEGTFALTWCRHWQKAVGKRRSPRIKLWIWKILRRAFFTRERAEKMRVTDDPCCRFKESRETVPHLFYECRYSRNRWILMYEKAESSRASFRTTHGLLEAVDEALCTKKKGEPLIFIGLQPHQHNLERLQLDPFPQQTSKHSPSRLPGTGAS
ncbi:hypothetical protein R1flu_006902 [Riccia fluitans]|uniref:Reverse transcriptase domain-containing protein n=1 Tax=Riccia fluitans TaxID=41844 RepID=A0ABD1YY34_9MARC